MRRTGPTQAVRDAVYSRDRFSCCRCGSSEGPFAIHHRLPRGRGGDNRLSNLVLLCDFGGCHDAAVESHRRDAYRSGWLVRTGQDPATVPLVWHGDWSLLDDNGDVAPTVPADRLCEVTGCPVLAHGHGYCSVHLQRIKKHGTPDPSPRVRAHEAIENLWQQLGTDEATREGACWPWPGRVNSKGYGETKRNGEHLASRAVWVEVFGPIPDGQCICHRCDNPPCVRPSHLFLGSPKDNTQDMIEKGRARPPLSLANGRAKLSDEAVAEIRRQVDAGRTHTAVAADFGICAPHVGRIVRRERRSAVEPVEVAS